MTRDTGDCELLRRYVARGDREALGEVVRRHIDFVYATARRQTRGDAHAAEDVTQAVFIVLARRAASVRSDAALPAWLFAVTRYAAASARRLEQRRGYHERRAARPEALHLSRPSHVEQDPDELLAQLDDAIAELSENDRRGVLLCYFQDLTFRDVGRALGGSEEAASKRVSRAVQRMRASFARRGVAVSGTTLSSAMVAQAQVTAPAQLVAPAANVAFISGSFTSHAIAKGAVVMLVRSTLKPLVAAAAALLVVVSGVVVGQVATQNPRDPRPAAAQAATEPKRGGGGAGAGATTADLGDGVRVEFVAVAPVGAPDGWHTPAGAAVSRDVIKELLAKLEGAQVVSTPPPTHRAIVRVTTPPASDVSIKVLGAAASGAVSNDPPDDESRLFIVCFAPEDEPGTIDLEVNVATGEWRTLVENESLDSCVCTAWGSPESGIMFSEMTESDGKPSIFVTTELTSQPGRVVALDDGGNILDAHRGGEMVAGRISTCRPVFRVDRGSIRKLEVQSRPYNKFVACRALTLDAKKPSSPKIETEKKTEQGKR